MVARIACLVFPVLLFAQEPDSTTVPSAAGDSSTRPTRASADSLYWQHRFSDARRAYESALAATPGDTSLRLAYGQMLVETLHAKRARQVITPLVGNSNGRAELLLGTNAYWSGDYTTAQKYFVDALRADSTLDRARLQLYEIAATTAPTLRLGTTIARDDQPLHRNALTVSGEYFLRPNHRFWARLEPMKFSGDRIPTRDFLRTEAGQSVYVSRLNIETDATFGRITQPMDAVGDWIGQLALGKRLKNHVIARVSAERDRYFHTLASIDTVIMTRTGRASVELDSPRGWLGEASLEREWFPDDNALSSAYLWFLAPLTRNQRGDLQAGYAFSAQSADDNRFALARPQQQFPPGDPRFDRTGRYSPYYTPDHLMTHSALVAATTRLGPTLTLHTNASVGLYATENAPAFVRVNAFPPAPDSIVRTSFRRSFTPWSARAALDIHRGRDWILQLTGDYQHTSFYSAGTATVQLTRRFTASAIRRADRY